MGDRTFGVQWLGCLGLGLGLGPLAFMRVLGLRLRGPFGFRFGAFLGFGCLFWVLGLGLGLSGFGIWV